MKFERTELTKLVLMALQETSKKDYVDDSLEETDQKIKMRKLIHRLETNPLDVRFVDRED